MSNLMKHLTAYYPMNEESGPPTPSFENGREVSKEERQEMAKQLSIQPIYGESGPPFMICESESKSEPPSEKGRIEGTNSVKRILTQEERTALYNDGLGITYPFDAPPKKLSNDNEYLPAGSGEQANNDTPFDSSSWAGLETEEERLDKTENTSNLSKAKPVPWKTN